VTAFQDECTRDLAVAEPVIIEAEAALNSLDKASLGELKSFGSPAADVAAVVSACMILTAPGGKIPKVYHFRGPPPLPPTLREVPSPHLLLACRILCGSCEVLLLREANYMVQQGYKRSAYLGTRRLFPGGGQTEICTLARNRRHTGAAPSNPPIVAGVFPQRNAGTKK